VALDSRDKRASAIGTTLPMGVAHVFEHPPSYSDTEASRRHKAHLYAVILTIKPSDPSVYYLCTNHKMSSPRRRNRGRNGTFG